MANSNYSRDSNQPTFVITNESGEQVHPPMYNYFTEDDRLNRMQYVWKHRRQMVALIPGFLILAASGMHLGWSIYFPTYSFMSRTLYEAVHLALSWFIGAIVGGLIAAFLVRATKRTHFSYISELLVIISGILFAALDLNFTAILVARYLGGIAHGIMFLTTVIHAGEIAAYKIRGFVTSSLALAITSGIMVASAITGNLWSREVDMTLNRLYGIVFIVLGCLAIVATPCTGKESPVYLIDNDKDDALEKLQRLRNEPPSSESTRREFMELRTMVGEDKHLSSSIISDGNGRALSHIIVTRLLLALSMFSALNYYQYFVTTAAIATIYGLLLLILGRFIGEIFSTNLMDILGRKGLLTASSALSGFMLLLTGILSFQSGDTITAFAILSFFYQLCLGLGITTASITYMSESFPLKKKPFSCFVCFSAEMLLHIAIMSILSSMETEVNLGAMYLSVGLIQIVAAILFYVMLDDTKMTSLRECRDIMQGR